VALHDAALEETKHVEPSRPGVFETHRLRSAVHMPTTVNFGEIAYPTLARMAAAYAFFVGTGHGFNDGNKRAALLISTAFLATNAANESIQKRWKEPKYSDAIVDLVNHRIDVDEVARIFCEDFLGGEDFDVLPVFMDEERDAQASDSRDESGG
jgi:prophage maintenance system killer protein